MVLYICKKFHNISNGFQPSEQSHGRNGYVHCSKGINSKEGKPELWFHVFCMLFHNALHENNADRIRVTEQTRMMQATKTSSNARNLSSSTSKRDLLPSLFYKAS